MPRVQRRKLRDLPPVTRQLAKLNNELASAHRRISNLLPKVEAAERDAQALQRHLVSLDGTKEQEEES